MEFIDVFHSF